MISVPVSSHGPKSAWSQLLAYSFSVEEEWGDLNDCREEENEIYGWLWGKPWVTDSGAKTVLVVSKEALTVLGESE